MLEIAGLTTAYGDVIALDDISLIVPAGAMVAVIGANGAGKTTLLKTVCGALRARRGSVRFDGITLTNQPAYRVARTGVLLVPEGRQVLAPLSVEENLKLGHLAARRRGGASNADLERVLDLFPILRERRAQAAGRLSGGQQQMLAIGRALMGRPRVLLLDEPSLGLSPIVVSQVFEVIKQLHAEGLTIMLVEQNARRALESAQYAYVMERGRIVLQGSSEDLRQDPAVVSHYLGQDRPSNAAASA